MNKKEIAIVSFFLILFSFPLIYLAMLIATGNAKIVFEGDMAQRISVENQVRLQRESEQRDSLIRENTLAFQAKVREGKRLTEQREVLQREQNRLERLREEVQQENQRLENLQEEVADLVGETEEVRGDQLRSLAEVYETMDTQAAARIFETLSDDLAIRLFNAMNEPRQKARILAAMEQDKATRISRKIGEGPQQ
ncbi:MotE family protein [Chitinivibrio alkaliphilus]|uniref:Magnesium transporter MgtE intracellular domain-containing protein n=1 Tax=Chitinivibrio alkaliphilus ACht1 TaxID=1313304 RepID=U7DCD4_9BACT|nr:hypothetical protein [Chitinivibrio alkaliphilus]ERP32085.1 hypothetical protein CALK_1072 [Chitinivibrio alkaliphilus ACht1]